MVFTLAQWDMVQQEKISVGAAPVRPTELREKFDLRVCSSGKVQFGFTTGYEEVEQILEENPLKPFDLQ